MKLLKGGLKALAVNAAKLLRTRSVNVVVRAYDRHQRSECAFRVNGASGAEPAVWLYVREATSTRPWNDSTRRQVAACIRHGTGKLRHRRSKLILWEPLPAVPLWRETKPGKAPSVALAAPPLSRKAKNARKAARALARCLEAMDKAAKTLIRLQKRHKELKRRVAYYEATVHEGPEFEAQLQNLVKAEFSGMKPCAQCGESKARPDQEVCDDCEADKLAPATPVVLPVQTEPENGDPL